MSLTLHFHPLASYCWKALIALYENDTPFTPNLVDLGNPAERAALLKLWPIGKFPVLRDDARERNRPGIEHHHRISRSALSRPHPVHSRRRRPRLADAAARPLLRSLCASADAEDHARPDAARGKKDPHGVEEARAQLRTSYAMIEQQMANGGWAMGDEFSLADCAAAPSLFYGSRWCRSATHSERRRLFRAAEGAALVRAGAEGGRAVFRDGPDDSGAFGTALPPK